MPKVTLEQAAASLRKGEVVAFPTETVYGLGADATQPLAVRKVFALKGRPVDHPLILHLGHEMVLTEWAVDDDRARELARRFWPGPLSLVLRRTARVIDEVTGGLDTVCVRMPSHPVARALLKALRRPLAAPSANKFGRISATAARHVEDEFGAALPVLDGGDASVGIESTIVDLTGSEPALLRPGAIPRRALEDVVGPLGSSQVTAPGTLPRHYAPRTALIVTADIDGEMARQQRLGLTVAVLRAVSGIEHARRLYAELRRLDALGVDVLIAEPSQDPDLGEAINDRLTKAERGSGAEESTRGPLRDPLDP